MEQLLAHLVGDYLLQSHWMALNKRSSSLACVIHCTLYMGSRDAGLAVCLATDHCRQHPSHAVQLRRLAVALRKTLMHGSIPHPDNAQLIAAHQLGACIPCHQCHGRRDGDCPSCLGSGYLRPCAACIAARTSNRVCAICNGLLFTAGDPPSARDGESAFGHTAYAVGPAQTKTTA